MRSGTGNTTKRRNLVLLAAAAALCALPLLLPVTGGMEEPFTGADGQATDAIAGLAPGYEPWAEPLWTPPSGEIESLLFALQAALGAGLIGYYVGLRRGQRGRRQRTAGDDGAAAGPGSAPTPALPRRAGEGGKGGHAGD